MNSATINWRHLTFDLLHVTRAGACAAAGFRGQGRPKDADAAAAQATRERLEALGAIGGRIVSGEGEKDGVPHLAYGETFGDEAPARIDVAVDPVDGTSRVSAGLGGAVAVLGAAPAGALLDPGPSFYMDKLVAGPAAVEALDPEAGTAARLETLAAALEKPLAALTVFVLDKPRHEALIEAIRAAGARVAVYPFGDVEGAVRAVLPGTGIDAVMGIGGTPEGLVAACAVRALGGAFFGRLAPQGEAEAQRLDAAGHTERPWRSVGELVASPYAAFSATGVTGGTLLDGVRPAPTGRPRTESLVAVSNGDAGCAHHFVESA